MGDINFNTSLPHHPSSYHGNDVLQDLDLWSEMTFLESQPAAQPLPITGKDTEDIEGIYAGLHQYVDQVISKIAIQSPSRLNQIREHNRKLIDKLTTLEHAISRHSTPAGYSPVLCISSLIEPGTASSSISRASSGSHVEDNSGQIYRHGHKTFPNKGSHINSKLAKKLLQIGNQETRLQVTEFAAKLNLSGSQSDLSSIRLPNPLQVANMPHFVVMVTSLTSTIERSTFGEQNWRIKKRIALAHFYYAYKLAQDHPKVFLSWCDDREVQNGSILPKRGNRSVVQHRFADLIFPRTEENGSKSSTRLPDSDNDSKQKIAKIQMWRKSGKKWAQLIQRFGYGILLLLPSSLSDEDLRIVPDEALTDGLDLIESQKYLFADILQQANDILTAHFFPQDGSDQLVNLNISTSVGRTNWEGLLNVPPDVGNWNAGFHDWDKECR